MKASKTWLFASKAAIRSEKEAGLCCSSRDPHGAWLRVNIGGSVKVWRCSSESDGGSSRVWWSCHAVRAIIFTSRLADVHCNIAAQCAAAAAANLHIYWRLDTDGTCSRTADKPLSRRRLSRQITGVDMLSVIQINTSRHYWRHHCAVVTSRRICRYTLMVFVPDANA